MTTPAQPPTGPDDQYGAPPNAWGPPPGPGQQPWGPPAPQGWGPAGPASGDETTWALLAHLSYFVLGLIGPLVIYLVKKDTSPFVRQHAAEALNFHITLTIAVFVSVFLMVVLIGFLLLPLVLIAGAVYAVLAAIAANKGQPYRYPLTLRLVS
ncbi:MAG: DUF4870 domain-containing protein [Actinomycetes bacterium]